MKDKAVRRFRKKPVVVEARQFTLADAENPASIEAWCNGRVRGTRLPPRSRIIQIDTLEGEVSGSIGDWIIKGVRGEFYPCRADIFSETYEDADSDQ